MANLSDLHEEILAIPGCANLPSGERTYLINEGMRELCVRSEWTRAVRNLGNTAIGQAAYTLDSDIYRILHVSVDNVPFASGDEQQVQSIIDGDLWLRSIGIYYTSFDSSGNESLFLYPTPDTAGLTINATVVYVPADLSAGPVTVLPTPFHRNIVHYAAFNALTDPDYSDQRDYFQTQYELGLERLRELRLSRQYRGPLQMGISGIHFRPTGF